MPSPELGQNVYFTVKCILKLSAPEFIGPLDLLKGSRLLGKLKFILNRLPAIMEAATKPHSVHKEGPSTPFQIRVPEPIIPEYSPPPFSLPRIWPPPRAPSACSPFVRGWAPQATQGGAVAVAALRPRHGTGSGGRRCRKLNSGAGALPGGSPPPVPATSRSTSGSFRSPPFSSSLGRAGGGGCRRAQYTACW